MKYAFLRMLYLGLTLKSDMKIILTNIHLYSVLAWEPSAAKVTKTYFRRLPALEVFNRETKFSLIKSTNST